MRGTTTANGKTTHHSLHIVAMVANDAGAIWYRLDGSGMEEPEDEWEPDARGWVLCLCLPSPAGGSSSSLCHQHGYQSPHQLDHSPWHAGMESDDQAAVGNDDQHERDLSGQGNALLAPRHGAPARYRLEQRLAYRGRLLKLWEGSQHHRAQGVGRPRCPLLASSCSVLQTPIGCRDVPNLGRRSVTFTPPALCARPASTRWRRNRCDRR